LNCELIKPVQNRRAPATTPDANKLLKPVEPDVVGMPLEYFGGRGLAPMLAKIHGDWRDPTG
jgi:hypothetical protein